MTVTEQEQGHFAGSFSSITGKLEFGYRMSNNDMLVALDLLRDIVLARLKGSFPGRPSSDQDQANMSVRVPGFDVRRVDK